jgi:hypothetical protein
MRRRRCGRESRGAHAMPQLLDLSLSLERERVERERSTARVEGCCRV